MLKPLFYILLILMPVMNRTGSGEPMPAKDDLHDLYASLNLLEKGLSHDVFQLALKGHHKLDHDGKLRNPGILSIIDFSQSSKNKRLYVIDLVHRTLLFNTYVAHGRNTGDQYAAHFSNAPGSYQSSLGFYITRQEIMGSSVGLSLILEGIEKGFNDNAVRREIIMHGADYATENFIKQTGRLGRSFGCPALPPELIKPVVETIKEGTCLFIYCKDNQYLEYSAMANIKGDS
jgi:hypothetical protein